MTKFNITLTIDKDTKQLLEKYAKDEYRSMSNMLIIMIRAYDKIHKQQY